MQTKLIHALCEISTLQRAWKFVKSKGSAGGVDGISIVDFERNLYSNISRLSSELKSGKWKPQPAKQIEIDKKDGGKRKIGMLSVGDKIVQHAIKSLIEPRLERMFVSNSYGYRPGRGAVKAARRALAESVVAGRTHVIRLDIDDFFDTIDHDILASRLGAVVADKEIVRLIMLIVKMGCILPKGRWEEPLKGTPQGAVLSPLLANLYLHSFDQFMRSKSVGYVRYADDFLIFCSSQEEVDAMLIACEEHLKSRLNLRLNIPDVKSINEGFEFLGVMIKDRKISISEDKRIELEHRVSEMCFTTEGFAPRCWRSWTGLHSHYAQLLADDELQKLDYVMHCHLTDIVRRDFKQFVSKAALMRAFGAFSYLSDSYSFRHKELMEEIVNAYAEARGAKVADDAENINREIIQSRRKEYRRKEAEGSELLVSRPGVFVGLTSHAATVREKKTLISQAPLSNLSHIVIIGEGVSLSSNLIGICMRENIPIDFFDKKGSHIASVLSPKFIESRHWEAQSQASIEKRNEIAMQIMHGKLRNQMNLVKYFHKYHKENYPLLDDYFRSIQRMVDEFDVFRKKVDKEWSKGDFGSMLGFESQIAVKYWAYIRQLLADDQVEFQKREHRGATDVMNAMLNYGYAILYSRCWQALLGAGLNPYDSVIHSASSGKPALLYDFVEVFRSQAVDRIVISMIQKGVELEVSDGVLSDETKKLLAQNIMIRFNRYEKFRGKEMRFGEIIILQAKELAESFVSNVKFKTYSAKW